MKATYQRYARLRDERGMTDYRVANETNIAKSTISDWKNGLGTPKVDKLLKIATLFGIRIEDMLEEVEEVKA